MCSLYLALLFPQMKHCTWSVSASLDSRVQAKSLHKQLPSLIHSVCAVTLGSKEVLWPKQQKFSLKVHAGSYGSFIVSRFKFTDT